ncbi:hypothetical protein IFM89_009220 [Coptis chinensis]|uniref:Uncharacterized protein n=1 Tax=Coptis chinensis TaxID=261450 RepID=A0A835IX93_9MAGN|nr:hypothetical protein IFM89_009220 [Coptis chinensis]
MLPKEFGIAPNYYLTIIIAAIIIEDENQGEEEVAIPYPEEEEQKVENRRRRKNNYGVRLITLVIRLLRATMVSIPSNLKWVFWIGLLASGIREDEYWGYITNCDFKDKLQMNKEKPAIINVNIGTTVKGAVDDLDLVIKTLEETGFSHD